nr:hypothetical protein [Thiocapsa sp.]
MQGDAGESVVKVVAEDPGEHGLPQVLVGGGNHAHVHLAALHAADGSDLAFLQDPQ